MKKILLGGAMSAISLMALGQYASPLSSSEPAGWLERAATMLRDGNYVGVLDELRAGDIDVEASPEVAWMQAYAAYECGDAEAFNLLTNFVRRYPASVHATAATLLIGDCYFFDHDFALALEKYDSADMDALDAPTRALYDYRRGVAMVQTGLLDEARQLLSPLRNNNTLGKDARFYLAYIDYAEGELDIAYRAFAALEGELPANEYVEQEGTATRRRAAGADRTLKARALPEATATGAGYYMTQIEYRRGEYSEALKHARAMLSRRVDPVMAPELHRIVGECYYRLGDTEPAYVYLSTYVNDDGVEHPMDTAVYTLGVLEYDRGDYDTAAELFGRLTGLRNSIGQSAYLYLGQCAVREGDDNAASMAFSNAYRMDFDSNVTENAFYNYLVSDTRGGRAPFASSVEMMEDFLTRFPNSRFAPQVEEYLATAYYNDRNYTKALQSINRIPQPSEQVLAAKQKILYECGTEAVASGNYSRAAELFGEGAALKRCDADLALLCLLCRGDALYRDGKYAIAADVLGNYVAAAPASDKNLPLGWYDYGYALYLKGDYTGAANAFSKVLNLNGMQQSLQHDARIRLADCQYYTSQFAAASKNYNAAVKEGGRDADYAAYRLAIVSGLLGDSGSKVAQLDALRKDYPSSAWLPAARLEKAMTLQAMGRTSESVATLEDLLKSYPNTATARTAKLELGLAYMQNGNPEKGAETFRRVIADWPGSDEARIAHENLRTYYASNEGLDEYSRFLKSIPGAPTLEAEEMDRLTYDAAAEAYGTDADTTQLLRYIDRYPTGKSLAPALLTLAEDALANGADKRAAIYIDRLLADRPDTPQGLHALLLKARMAEKEGYSDAAADAYETLLTRGAAKYAPEAEAGLMRTATKAADRLAYARKIAARTEPSSDEGQQARYVVASILKEQGKNADAIAAYKEIIDYPSTLCGAKANVELAELYLATKRPEQALDLMTKFTDEGTPLQYWLARGYIALADAYKALGKNTTATEYLRSLAGNYPYNAPGYDEINRMVTQRLSAPSKKK